jgi:hypothetical protein
MAHCAISENRIRILNLDESLLKQTNLLKWASGARETEIIDLSEKGPYLRYWAAKKDLDFLRRTIAHTHNDAITLYGSGDFHHLSVALIEQFTQPLSLIVFDHHPDWDGISARVSCGSWISAVSRKENIKKILLLGPSSNDLSGFGLFTASLKSLNGAKLEIYPYMHKPSRLFLRKLKDTSSFKVRRSFLNSLIDWQNLCEANLEVFLSNILEGIATEDVYVSIDKDCLRADYAVTNWESGLMDINWLLEAVSIVKNKKNIVGMDITGEYSAIRIKSGWKNFISRLDHPSQAIDSAAANQINEAANLSILKLFLK